MGSKKDLAYTPDYAVPPGETLLETLQATGMSQADLAARTGRPLKTINEIIKGKEAITPRTALQFERVLGIPASFWNNLERNYREAYARIEEKGRLKGQAAWLKRIPYRAMAKTGWIRLVKDDVEQIKELLAFFGIASPERWGDLWEGQVAYRKSPAFQSDPGAVAAWLRKGEMEAKTIDCRPYEEGRFREALNSLRPLTKETPVRFMSEMTRVCAKAGVAVVLVPELPRTRVCGATRWLSSTKALIQLSFRYKTDDHLWFTFFHEAGHILLHGKREVFIEGEEMEDGKEREADRFASDFLIPAKDYRRLVRCVPTREEEILDFADEIGIAPGIVVGRLQHDGHLPMKYFNDLKRKVDWKKVA